MSELETAALVPSRPSDDVLHLALGAGISLILSNEGLVVKDKSLAKRNRHRLCGVPIGSSPAHITLPYYNILSASVESDLVIDYATVQPETRPSHVRLQYPLGEVSIAIAQAWAETLLKRAYGQAQRQRRAKVLINPHAGPGGAVRIWDLHVKPFFEAARMTLDVVTTSRGGEGTEICETLDVDAFDVVVVCSGDGLAYEVFNGFGKRADAGSALKKIAVAHIPCGSGNAMSCNLNGSYHPGPSALAVIKGIRTPFDLMSVTQGSERTLSFLSQSVGIIAEADLGTENMRWLGAKRFDVGVVQRIFSKKVYPCDVSIKVEIESKDQVKAHYRQIRNNTGHENIAQASPPSIGPDAGEGLPPLRFGTVNDEIPEDWQTTSHDNMGNFYCGNMAWMAPEANFFSAACINDGLMDIVINDGNIPTLKYIELMTSIEAGKYFDNPLISYRKIVAYRFTPRDQNDGYISIDGEHVPFQPFQVEVHPGLATVISKSGRYEANGPPNWQQSP